MAKIIILMIFINSPGDGNYYFTADWCSACQKQTPIIKKLQKDFDIKIYNEEKFKEFNIKALPTIIIIKNNKETRLEGLQSTKKLTGLLK